MPTAVEVTSVLNDARSPAAARRGISSTTAKAKPGSKKSSIKQAMANKMARVRSKWFASKIKFKLDPATAESLKRFIEAIDAD